MTTQQHSAFDQLMTAAREGQLSRRELIRRGVALGLTASAVGAILAACGTTTPTATTAPASAAPASTAPAASVAPAASSAPAASAAATARPSAAAASASTSASTAPGKRGGAGVAKLLWWQGPVILNPHLAAGTKDFDASRVVYEPLATFDGEEKLIPVLAAELPTKENGGLAPDGKSVTWKLKKDVKWSDGKPFTADDVVFTYQYTSNREAGTVSFGIYAGIQSVEKVDDYTVKINFKDVTPGWYTVFSATNGCVLPKHIFQDYVGTKAKDAPPNLKPVGTGPYVVESFKPGDEIIYKINQNYRDPNKPAFDEIQLKGGGDAPTAARAVLVTGDYDFAWNLQVEWSVLSQLKQQAQKGELLITDGSSAERILVNFTDPNKEDPETQERSSIKFPHPFQTDLKVRQAYALLADRDTIAKTLYGETGVATANLINAPASVRSPNTKYEFNIDKANAILEEAGYKKGSDGIRAKDGKKMSVLFQTSVNSLRQKEQQIIKDAFEKAGIAMELKAVDQTAFFSAGAGTIDNHPHFYADLQMYTNGPDLPDSQNWFRRFLTSERAQKANNWGGINSPRYSNPKMDQLYQQAAVELDEKKRTALFIEMNDLAFNDVVEVALVYRSGASAKTKTLKWSKNSPWDSNLWNTADWGRN